jgi:two-component system, NtrC family, sensor kinase
LMVNTVGSERSHSIQLLITGRDLVYDFAVPVMISSHRIGTVRLGLSQRKIEEAIDRLLFAILATGSIAILLAALVGAALARTVTRGVDRLRRSAEEIVKGNLDIQSSPPLKNPCWIAKQCDRRECPAYGDTRYRCWYLSDTMCSEGTTADFPGKLTDCAKCSVYRLNSGDEIQHLAEYFDLMARALRTRLEDLKETQRDLEQQQDLFRTIIDVTPDLLYLKGPDLRYRAVNKAFCTYFGRGQEEVLGKEDLDVFSSGQAQENREEELQVLSGRSPVQGEAHFHGVSGPRWFHVVRTPVVDRTGQVAGLLCNARDITEFREIQQRMVQSQKLESLGQLAAGVAHEINTPLGIILGFAQVLLSDFPPETEAHGHLRKVEKHARICKKIVADLLRFSRHTETDKRPLDLNVVLEQVLSVVEHSFYLDRIEIQRRFAQDLPLIYGDQEKLQQVFLNLLNNAHDAIGSDGRLILSTSYHRENDEVLVCVADSGPGIPEEIRHKVFDPFFTTKPVGKGTGLGLSVTFGIVKEHGGRIDIRSEEKRGNLPTRDGPVGGGASFTLCFPVHHQ